ncbi:transglutaminase-like domain-containing protein [Tenacibaculum jejuense]|uniref:Transglutaminase domain protein n=1 Tax=Tenacibaculum jejuense TaxID=584609 RepID=A0A238U7W8_9FLAO
MKHIWLLLLISVITLSNCKNKYPSKKVHEINFSKNDTLMSCDFIFSNPKQDSSLIALKTKYNLDSLTKKLDNDVEKVLYLTNWVHKRWQHDGNHNSGTNNVLEILQRAENGENFRCVEYGKVLSACLNSIGIPTRTLGLKTKDVEYTEYNAGHVVSEAYIKELKKWIFIDPQINYVPFHNDIPLNAVEYQRNIIDKSSSLKLKDFTGTLNEQKAAEFTKWIGKYLYFFDSKLDNSKTGSSCQNKSYLMLVPLKSNFPKVFQIKHKMDYLLYTNNLNDFYKAPIIQ